MGCMKDDVFLLGLLWAWEGGRAHCELPGAAASCAHPRCFAKIMINISRIFNLPIPYVTCTCKSACCIRPSPR